MKYEPFSELIEPYLEGPFSAMPDELRQRLVDSGSLLGSWDAFKPEDRRSLAEQHDSQYDPARRDWRNRIDQLTGEIEDCYRQIAEWEPLKPQSITEIGAKNAKLAALDAEIAALHQQLITPYSATPAQAPNAEAPEAVVEAVAPLVTVAEKAATDVPKTAPVDPRPDPERRLALLRELKGTATYDRSKREWVFTGISALVKHEKLDGRKRCTEKTLRADLKEAAQSERDAGNATPYTGLGQR